MLFTGSVTDATGILTVTTQLAICMPLSLSALMVAVPAETAVTLPFVSTLATDELSDIHVAPFMVAFEGLYVTVSELEAPVLSVSACLLSTIDVIGFASVLMVTVHTAFILPLESVTVIFAEPVFRPETTPFVLTVATAGLDELQFKTALVALYGVR